MAEIDCYSTDIWIEGETEAIHVVAEKINKGDFIKQYIADAMDLFGFERQRFFKSVTAEVTDASGYSAMNLIAQLVCEPEEYAEWEWSESPMDVYFQTYRLSNEDLWTNDVNGKYFPYRYMLNTSSYEKKFVKFDDTINFIKENCQHIYFEVYPVRVDTLCPPVTRGLILCVLEEIKNLNKQNCIQK